MISKKKRISFLCLFWSIYFSAFSQEALQKLSQRYRVSFETVQMDNEPDLGFLGKGLDVFGLVGGAKNLYLGLHTFSAITGKRPGLITLGMEAGYRFQLFKSKKIYLQAGLFVGGGGGGGAPDGGGLIIRPNLALEVLYKKFAIQGGYSKITFPSGAIDSNHFFIAAYIYTDVFWKDRKMDKKALLPIQTPIFKKVSFSVEGIYYFDFGKNSIDKPSVKNAQLLGVYFKRNIGKNLYSAVRLNGALGGGIDGYMSVLAGGGYEFHFLRFLKIAPNFLMGAGGGGAVASGGGATMQLGLDTQINLFNNYALKFILGKTWAPWGAFKATHFGLGVTRELEIIAGVENKNTNTFLINDSLLKEQNLGIAASNRTYFGMGDKKDKNGKTYLPMFQLLGFEILKKINKRWAVSGATFWAYQGSYGAYAEGLFGLSYAPFISKGNKFYMQVLAGAAGGGGIDVGAGLLFEYGLGYERQINERWAFFVKGFRVQPLSGNFTPYSLDVGLQIWINQFRKK